MLTVGELIRALSQFDPSLPVLVSNTHPTDADAEWVVDPPFLTDFVDVDGSFLRYAKDDEDKDTLTFKAVMIN